MPSTELGLRRHVAASGNHRRRTRGDAVDIGAGETNSIAVPERAVEPRAEKRVAHRWRRIFLQNGAGSRQRQKLDHGPGPGLVTCRLGKQDADAVDG